MDILSLKNMISAIKKLLDGFKVKQPELKA